jgi:hypothetical protein
MLESIQQFISNNATLVLVAVCAMVVVVGFIMYRRNNSNGYDNGPSGTSVPVPTPSHDLDGMDSVNAVCDLSSGVCHPQNLTPEQEQQIMMQQQMMMQQMQQQQAPEQHPEQNVNQ